MPLCWGALNEREYLCPNTFDEITQFWKAQASVQKLRWVKKELCSPPPFQSCEFILGKSWEARVEIVGGVEVGDRVSDLNSTTE